MKQKSQPDFAIALNAYRSIVSGDFDEAVTLYEEAIALEPKTRANYGYLGLAMLLQDREADAQMAWFSAVDDPEEFDDWVKELERILNSEAERYSNQSEIHIAWLIRQHLAEISPQNLHNLTELARLSLENPVIDPDEQNLSKLIEVLEEYTVELSDSESIVLQNFVEQLLVSTSNKEISNFGDLSEFRKLDLLQRNRTIIDIAQEELSTSITFVQLYLQKLEPSRRAKSVNSILLKLREIPPQVELVYIKVCLDLYPDSPQILRRIAVLLQELELYFESVEFALQTAVKSEQTSVQAFGYYSATRGLLNAGFRWKEAEANYSTCCDLLQILIQQAKPLEFSSARFIASYGVFTYILRDIPAANHSFLGRLGAYYQSQIRRLLGNLPLPTNRLSRLTNQARKLRIGYIAETLYRHSVGWISRWLLLNHNYEKFDIFVYSLSSKQDDCVQISLQNSVTSFHNLTIDANAPIVGIKAIVDQIQNDGIDILVDLDSLTSVDIGAVIALKPAPIQVTWLGSDASGIPAINYFIADPYVLPDDAQSYYSAKIWRLPHTYVAVNGFEVGTPNLHRSDLQIPHDAIVYLSVQSSHKRHPDVLRHQMQILHGVPNSYFLIKSTGLSISFEEKVIEIALEEGILLERIRFLPITSTSEIHRANFAIADIILDTYPYSGATTTLEALWMEVPIVTRVGEQFVSRNSYTMMLNAGITEGIAWTVQEYVEWGIRLGNDADLRQQISWKLKKSKQTSPLWDVKQFAREMEFAYEQMWTKYVESEIQGLSIEEPQLENMAEAEAQNSQGIRFAQESNLEEAITCFKSAIFLNPQYPEAHYNLGIALDQKDQFEAAITCFQNAIGLNPEYADAYFNLGLVLTHQDKYKEAVNYFQQALQLSPQDFEYHLAMGNALLEQRKWEESLSSYKVAIQINPKSASVNCSMGLAFRGQQKYAEAVSYLQSAIKIDPELAEAHNALGLVFSKLDNKQVEAIQCFQTAINLEPDLAEVYTNLIALLNDAKGFLGSSYSLQKELADRFLANCKDKNRVRALINSINVYLKMGLGDQVYTLIDELEKWIYQKGDRLMKKDILYLYITYIFLITSLRDDQKLNSKVLRAIGDLYVTKILQPESLDFVDIIELGKNSSLVNSKSDGKLKIGILSSYFARHPVGWCSLDVIRELSYITPHIYLYSTSEIIPDERTQSFQDIAEKCFWQLKSNNIDPDKLTEQKSSEIAISELIEEMIRDDLDVLIDLDSSTVADHMSILYQHPATICLSWLGFDAPYISADNYCLCDWYTHPSGVEQNYLEQLVRLPDAHMAVSGFEVISGVSREDFEIGVDQVVYLYAAAGRKFNRDTAKAHTQILKRVPNSVLMYKGSGDHESIQSVYLKECELQMIDGDRIKFIPSTKKEEEHRAFYGLADVFLDAYPYNGGSHNLEALWFNLPIVTRVGEQSFARMGYSFLQALGINEGIASSWEEYVEWGVKLGKDTGLRTLIINKLIQSKQDEALAPLWNPKKLANDMYDILRTLIDDREIKYRNTINSKS